MSNSLVGMWLVFEESGLKCSQFNRAEGFAKRADYCTVVYYWAVKIEAGPVCAAVDIEVKLVHWLYNLPCT